jgi:hypothetical protein
MLTTISSGTLTRGGEAPEKLLHLDLTAAENWRIRTLCRATRDVEVRYGRTTGHVTRIFDRPVPSLMRERQGTFEVNSE